MRLEAGLTAVTKRVFSQVDIDRFAALSGDDNPIHVDPDFSGRTRFGRTVCHGMLLYSAICQVLGEKLPGPGTVQLEQDLMFVSPTFADEEVTIRIKVLDVQLSEGTARLETVITGPNAAPWRQAQSPGPLACQGHTVVALSPGALDRRHSTIQIETSGVAAMKGLTLGQRAQTTRVFTSDDLAEYVDLTGDANPIFTDAGSARQSGLDGLMVPGGLLGGLFSYLLGTKLPGRGTNWLKQRLLFLKPAYLGEEIRAEVEIVRLRPGKELVNLRTTCWDQQNQILCEGEALVLIADLEAHTTSANVRSVKDWTVSGNA